MCAHTLQVLLWGKGSFYSDLLKEPVNGNTVRVAHWPQREWTHRRVRAVDTAAALQVCGYCPCPSRAWCSSPGGCSLLLKLIIITAPLAADPGLPSLLGPQRHLSPLPLGLEHVLGHPTGHGVITYSGQDFRLTPPCYSSGDEKGRSHRTDVRT